MTADFRPCCSKSQEAKPATNKTAQPSGGQIPPSGEGVRTKEAHRGGGVIHGAWYKGFDSNSRSTHSFKDSSEYQPLCTRIHETYCIRRTYQILGGQIPIFVLKMPPHVEGENKPVTQCDSVKLRDDFSWVLARKAPTASSNR